MVPNLQDAIEIPTPITLAKNPAVKISPEKVKEWTKAARLVAAAAPVATSVDHLTDTVECNLDIFSLV